jgi:PhnB protein
MAKVSIYITFNRNTEEAFTFYKNVFGTEYIGHVARMDDAPRPPEYPPLAPEDKNLIMHVALPLLGDMVLMGTDATESMGFKLVHGNNISLNLEPDTRGEADRLFTELSAGGKIEVPMQEMFWGAYFGSFTDKFGIQWMVNTEAKS